MHNRLIMTFLPGTYKEMLINQWFVSRRKGYPRPSELRFDGIIFVNRESPRRTGICFRRKTQLETILPGTMPLATSEHFPSVAVQNGTSV